MEPITYAEYVKLSGDLNNREKFRAYSTVVRGEGGFDFRVVPNPDLVTMTEEEAQLENAMQIGNDTERAARKFAFTMDRIFSRDKPVLVSEGDSWFQFPILVREIIDYLNEQYAILSLGAAGDTAQNMVHGNLSPTQTEYLTNLRAQAQHVKAFLFSAAGNDIIGEDPVTKKSALFDILNDFNGDTNDIAGHINEIVLAQRMAALQAAYSKVIADVRAEPGLQRLPIIFHGYDYPFPAPWGPNDPRNPIHAKKNEWLGEPLDDRNFPTSTQAQLDLRRGIVKELIDRLYAMLNGLAGNSVQTGIWVVDCRGAMPDVTDWIDEIHGTSQGFGKVTELFRATLSSAMANA
ncbi:hypothetical protein [Hoeflea poritis]|uniref:SGNH hydrolase-type esterase domain-containing protein n=1 Tax=Hoeflea poritis TaxID=2993659 RepID=A0ABT4VW10_9HYPH|nr:hypothetical protein [Hoeflea poritis]MDA4848829.1 hypothetical protein [Hoeflea poritis]